MSQMPREVVCPLLPCDVAGAGKPQKLLENVVRVQLPLTQQAREQRGHPVPLDFKVFLDLHFFLVGLSLHREVTLEAYLPPVEALHSSLEEVPLGGSSASRASGEVHG